MTTSLENPSDRFDLRHAATDRATIVRVPERRMLAIDGVGAPGGGPHRLAADLLFGAAEALRTTLHRRHVDVRVGVLESAWWTHPEPRPDAMAASFRDRTAWHWQLMIEVPEQATDDEAEAALASARSGGAGTPARLIRFLEGESAQILHVGPVGAEADAVQRLFDLVLAAGLHPHGHLHELHLADPRHVDDARRRTILRLPIEREPTS